MRPKTFKQFASSLDLDVPPNDWPEALQSLWFDAKGDWEASHNIAQDLPTTMGSWIHAYLHRKEGDEWNAGYWYDMAGRSFPNYSLEEELEELVEANL